MIPACTNATCQEHSSLHARHLSSHAVHAGSLGRSATCRTGSFRHTAIATQHYRTIDFSHTQNYCMATGIALISTMSGPTAA